MASIERPGPAELERIAELQPDLLNVLVAYFVMEWRKVQLTDPPHGRDREGKVCVVPDYVQRWGVDTCLRCLLQAPMSREANEPGFLTRWLEKVSR